VPGPTWKISKTKDNLKFLVSDETVKRYLVERLQTLEDSDVFTMLNVVGYSWLHALKAGITVE